METEKAKEEKSESTRRHHREVKAVLSFPKLPLEKVTQVLQNYPNLTRESLQAVFAFSAECLREEAMYAIES